MMRRLAILAPAALALASCVAGPNYRPPAPPAAAGYQMAGEDAGGPEARLGALQNGPWWRNLGSSALDQTIVLALASSPSLEAADASLSRAEAAVKAARAGLYPELDATAGVQRERINLASFGFTDIPGFPNNPTFTLYSLGATASYAIPVAGGVRRGVEAARARARAQARDAQAAGLTLTGQVAMQAATIAAVRAEIAVDEEIVADDGRLVDLAARAVAAGGEPARRRVGAQSQLAADEALLPRLRQNLDAARHALALLVGKAPADWRAPDFAFADFTTPKEVPLALPSELVRRRPDILAAEEDLHAATADVGVAAAKLYPNLTLTGAFTQASLNPQSFFNFASTAYTLGVGATEPIFDGGRLRAERREAEAARREALATYEATVLRAFQQVADVLASLGHDEAMISAEERAQDAAQADLAIARKGYLAGGLALAPVLDAERALASARRGVVEAKAKRLLDIIDLYVAAGSDFTR